MAEITLKFALRDNKICLCAYTKGKNLRHYKVVDLKTHNLKKWDQKAQKFTSRSEEDKHSNEHLQCFLQKYQELLNKREFESGQELFAYQEYVNKGLDPDVEIKKERPATPTTTLGEWVQRVIEGMLNPTRLKPSGTYQKYLTLLHKLEKERKIINQPIAEINDQSFMQFAKWVNKQPPAFRHQGNNYIKTMQALRAVVNYARKARLTSYVPDWPYMDYAPVKDIVSDKAEDVLINGGVIKSLTTAQYASFLDMDLNIIKMNGGAIAKRYKELYRDFCILLYEMKSRPIDIIKLHWENIALDPITKQYTCTYIPAKKKNYGRNGRQSSNPLVIQFLTPTAMKVIMKYKGESDGGYVLPFGINQKRWNLDDPQQFRTHYNQANRLEGRINKFLHRVGKILELPFQLTLYAFRRTAITQAIIDNKMPLPIIAKIAGTSVDMIDKHYANYLQALAAY